jgi:hypothetical protein
MYDESKGLFDKAADYLSKFGDDKS